MTQREFYQEVANKLNAEDIEIGHKEVKIVADALIEFSIREAGNAGEVKIPGLGKLILVDRKARMGRNPATGETIKIAAKKVVKFRLLKSVKDAVLAVKKAPKKKIKR